MRNALSLPAWFSVPFVLTLLIWSYLPFTQTPFVMICDVPIKSTDACLFCLLAVFGAAAIMTPYKNERVKETCGTLAVWFSGALVYAAITMLWSDLDGRNTLGMAYTLICGAVCLLIPYVAYRVMSSSQIRGVLWGLSGFLAIVSLSYFVQSFFGLHLRTRSDYEVITFGMERVAGPMFYSATLHFQLLPAAAFILSEALQRRVRVCLAVPMIAIILAALLGAGSRSALISLSLFLVLLGISLRGRSKLVTVALAVVICATAIGLLSTKAKSDRFVLSDPMREQTYTTSMAIVSDQAAMGRIFGDGYGHWWPWYVTDLEGGGAQATGRVIQSTNYGPTLYHPHSVLLISLVELGLIGLLPFLALLIFLLKLGLSIRPQEQFIPLLCSLAALVPAFGIDTFIVKEIKQNLVWWFFVLGACVLRSPCSRVRNVCRAGYRRSIVISARGRRPDYCPQASAF